MQIVYEYSHLNGLEYMQVHKASLLDEIRQIIAQVDAEACRTKASKEKRRDAALLYAPIVMNQSMKEGFERLGWHESRTSYWVTSDA